MNPFSHFHNDLVTITKPDGSIVAENVKADVQTNMIFIDVTHIPIEMGDIISRSLPSGIVESFVVEDPGFHAKFGSIPAGYQIKVSRKGAQPKGHIVHQYHATGPNSRINIASFDASANVVNASNSDELFAKLATALEAIGHDAERERMRQEVDQLKAAVGTPSFGEQYQNFIASTAAHITILTPFIPALTALATTHH